MERFAIRRLAVISLLLFWIAAAKACHALLDL